MEYPAVPAESKKQIDAAGELLASDTAYIGGVEHARQLVAKWRACHLLPLRAIADDLRERLERLGIESFVAMRLKRLFRIRDKLRQFPEMKATRMQDIGALRAVLPSLADVRRLVDDFERNPPDICESVSHKFYIDSPKDNGYRSQHIVFKYKGSDPSQYDGIRIELQIRTQLQHLWASAVEVTGLRTGSQLKYDEGDPAWAGFFCLTAELIARNEGCPSQTALADIATASLCTELVAAEESLGAIEILRSPSHPITLTAVEVDEAAVTGKETVLLNLDLGIPDLNAAFYSVEEQKQAMIDYADAEQRQIFEDDNTSVVLVSINSVRMLHDAYPTFFLDTSKFAAVVETLFSGEGPSA